MTRRSINNRGSNAARASAKPLWRVNMLGIHWHSFGGEGGTSQSTIKCSSAARASARPLWILKMLGIHYGSSGTHRPVNNKGFECRPRLCKASMECEHAWKSLEFLKGPTDQSTIRDSDAARASARLLWRVEMFGIHWNSLGWHRSANNKRFGRRPRRCMASMEGELLRFI